VPSLATFWTGLPPVDHGAVDNFHVLQAPTRAEDCRRQGWDTVGAVANRALGQPLGFERGFAAWGLFAGPREPLMARSLTTRAAESIREGRQLLLWAHYMAPHQPYTPPPPDDTRWAGPEGPPADNDNLYALHRNPELATPEVVSRFRALYDGEVHTALGYVQELLQGLDRAYREAGRGGLLENAVVVFFADHGEELGDRHGYFLHAKSLYSGVIRVPLVIAGPGVAAGRRVAAPVALGEVLPAVLADRVGELGKAGDGPERLFVASWKQRYWAVRDARWTLVHNPCSDPAGPREPPRDAAYPYPELALYDRAADPLEQRDVAAEHPGEVRRLLAGLDAWWRARRPLPPLRPDQVRSDVAPPADLQALGYLGDGEEQEGGSVCPPWPGPEGPGR